MFAARKKSFCGQCDLVCVDHWRFFAKERTNQTTHPREVEYDRCDGWFICNEESLSLWLRIVFHPRNRESTQLSYPENQIIKEKLCSTFAYSQLFSLSQLWLLSAQPHPCRKFHRRWSSRNIDNRQISSWRNKQPISFRLPGYLLLTGFPMPVALGTARLRITPFWDCSSWAFLASTVKSSAVQQLKSNAKPMFPLERMLLKERAWDSKLEKSWPVSQFCWWVGYRWH